MIYVFSKSLLFLVSVMISELQKYQWKSCANQEIFQDVKANLLSRTFRVKGYSR